MKVDVRTYRVPGGPVLPVATLLAITLLTGCAAPFADLQGARLAGKGRTEITPSFSSVGYSAQGESETLQREYTVQLATGVSESTDLRVRYTRVAPPPGSGGEGGINILAAGPKFAIKPGRVAVAIPVGLAFGNGIEVGETIQVHPALFITAADSRDFEVNLSGKALLPVSGGNIGLAANLGLGLSTNLDRWALRPEVGVLKYTGDEGYVRQASIGLSLNLGR